MLFPAGQQNSFAVKLDNFDLHTLAWHLLCKLFWSHNLLVCEASHLICTLHHISVSAKYTRRMNESFCDLKITWNSRGGVCRVTCVWVELYDATHFEEMRGGGRQFNVTSWRRREGGRSKQPIFPLLPTFKSNQFESHAFVASRPCVYSMGTLVDIFFKIKIELDFLLKKGLK